MPEWMSNSAHNGYFEAYLEGGQIEIMFLIVFLLAVWWKINAKFRDVSPRVLLNLSFFMAGVLANISESYFARRLFQWT